MMALATFLFSLLLHHYLHLSFPPAMSQQAAEVLLPGYEPTRQARPRLGCRVALSFDVVLEQGRAVFDYARLHVGQDGVNELVRGGPHPPCAEGVLACLIVAAA